MKYVIKVDVDVVKPAILPVTPERVRKVLNVDITHESDHELSDGELKEIVINVVKSFKALDDLERIAKSVNVEK